MLVALNNAIPVPDRDVSLDDVLEFKRRRQPELLALRHEVESLYHSVSASDDHALAVNRALDTIRIASDDCVKTLREARLPFRLTTEIASCNVVAAATAATAGFVMHAPLMTILSNVATASVAVGAGFEFVSRRGRSSPYRYISYFHEELFGA